MARGRRTSLADLAGDPIGDELSPDTDESGQPTRIPLGQLIANPHNPRKIVGEVSDLKSIADVQLQPAVVVTAAAFLNLWPDAELDRAAYVVINGVRRLKAAHTFGRTDLEATVKNELARDRATLRAASIEENVGREDLNVIDEANAVEALVGDCGGSADAAAARLNKSKGWVSQRRALLKLAPELQERVRAGELAVRVARSLARVPLEQQVSSWLAAQERADRRREAGEESLPPRDRDERPSTTTRHITRALRDFDTQPAVLATALRKYLGDDRVETLIAVLSAPQ